MSLSYTYMGKLRQPQSFSHQKIWEAKDIPQDLGRKSQENTLPLRNFGRNQLCWIYCFFYSSLFWKNISGEGKPVILSPHQCQSDKQIKGKLTSFRFCSLSFSIVRSITSNKFNFYHFRHSNKFVHKNFEINFLGYQSEKFAWMKTSLSEVLRNVWYSKNCT